MNKLSTLETLARAATPGRWERRKWLGDEWPEKRISVASGMTSIVISPRYAQEQAEHDAAYIAAANPAAVLKLCEIIRAQHEALTSVAKHDERERKVEWYGRSLDEWLSAEVDEALAKANEVLGDSHV
jgi:hypothetical protein